MNTIHVGCEKCQQHRELETARMLLGGMHYGEQWSGHITRNGVVEKRWYDVAKAKNTLRVNRVSAEHCQLFSVPMLWEAQIRDSYIVEGYLPHVNTDAPILLVTTHIDPVHGDCITLVDGIHRVARAHRDGVAAIPGFKFSLAFSQTLLIDPRTAIINELVAEFRRGPTLVNLEIPQ